jgi:four helix bundle protein
MKLADSLPNSCSARAIANQLVRCGMSVGANLQSGLPSTFQSGIHREDMGVVDEEAGESVYWLELPVDAGLKSNAVCENLRAEREELLKIVVASIRTARPQIRNPQFAIRNR